jgi:hypothetical protein
MARTTAKRKYIRRPGIVDAAKALGCSVSHLRRVVITKERSSRSLLERFREFKKTGAVASAGGGKHHNSPKPTPPSISYAAAQNLSPAFFAILEALGQNVVIVAFKWTGKQNIEQLLCENELNAALIAAQAGNYDSTHYDLGEVWHFFHVCDLAKAMQILRDEIAARGLLDRTTILHVEEHNKLRVWYPPTAEQIDA